MLRLILTVAFTLALGLGTLAIAGPPNDGPMTILAECFPDPTTGYCKTSEVELYLNSSVRPGTACDNPSIGIGSEFQFMSFQAATTIRRLTSKIQPGQEITCRRVLAMFDVGRGSCNIYRLSGCSVTGP